MKIEARATVETAEEWSRLQSLLQPSYQFDQTDIRVCFVAEFGEEVRHVEMPLHVLNGLIIPGHGPFEGKWSR